MPQYDCEEQALQIVRNRRYVLQNGFKQFELCAAWLHQLMLCSTLCVVHSVPVHILALPRLCVLEKRGQITCLWLDQQ